MRKAHNIYLFFLFAAALSAAASGVLLTYSNGYFGSVPSLLFLVGMGLCLYFPLRLFRKRLPRFYYRVTAVYWGLFVAVMAVELIFRLFTPSGLPLNDVYYLRFSNNHQVPYHVRHPNDTVFLTSQQFSHKRITNSLGFSDTEPEMCGKGNLKRILVLGDSFTEGFGSHADSTWPRFAERALNSGDTALCCILNAGVSGSDPLYSYVLLRDKLADWQPHTVILAFGYDLDDIIVRGGMERFGADGTVTFRRKVFWEPLYAVSYLVRFVVHYGLGLNHMFLTPESYDAALDKAVETLRESVFLYRGLAEMYDFNLLFVFCPSLEETRQGHYNHMSELVQYTKMCNFKTLDLLDVFSKQMALDSAAFKRFFWQQEGHYTADGNAAAGQALADKLRSLGWI